MKKLVFVILCCALSSCTSKRDALLLFEEIAQKMSFEYVNYDIGDFRGSSYYIVEHGDERYIARMPVIVDTLISLNKLLDEPVLTDSGQERYAVPVATHSEEANEIKNLCLLFREVWQMSPKEIFLRQLETDQSGNVKLDIVLKSTKKEYQLFITPDSLKVEWQIPKE